MATDFMLTGRLVQGDVVTARTTDSKGQPLVIKTGPNKGQPRTEFFAAIAVGKNDPEWAAYWAKAHATARAGFAHLFTPDGTCTHPRFAWKYADGDGVDQDGKPNNKKPGFANNFVVRAGGGFAPQLLDQNAKVVTDPAMVRQMFARGNLVRIIGSMSDNTGSDVPGLYVNLHGVQFVGYGEPITSGPDVAAAFAAAGPVALPAGYSAVPLAPTAVPALPPAPGGALPTPPGAAALPTPPGAALPGSLPPPAAALPGPPPVVQAVVTLLPHVVGHTLETLRAAGYTDDVMIANGWAERKQPPPNHAFVQGALPQVAPPAAAPALPSPPPVAAPPAVAAGLQPTATGLASGHTYAAYRQAGYTDDMLIAQGLFTR